MKKIISLITIAFVLIIGFASCSGDLHDNNAFPIVRGLNGWETELRLVDGEAEFTVQENKEQNVAILLDKKLDGAIEWLDDWNSAIRGASVYAGSLPSGVTLENNIGTENVKLVGLMAGVTYIMKVDVHDESVAYISISEVEPDGLLRPAQIQGPLGNGSLEWNANTNKTEATATYEVIFPEGYEDTWNEKNKNTYSFVLLNTANDWNNDTTYRTDTAKGDSQIVISLNGESKTLNTAIGDLGYGAKNNLVEDSKITGGSTIILTFTSTKEVIKVSARLKD